MLQRVCLCLALSAMLLCAQTGVGLIQGTVKDASGAMVPRAVVDLENVQTVTRIQTTTSEVGTYIFPALTAGEYRLTLHFAETWFGTPESRQPALDSRIFNVFANGVSLLRDYQIVKDAGGPNRSVERVFDRLVPNAQGELLLEFIPVRNYAELNAIEVVESR